MDKRITTCRLESSEAMMLFYLALAFVVTESILYAVQEPYLLAVYVIFIPVLLFFRMKSKSMYVSAVLMIAVLMISEWSYVLDDVEQFSLIRLRLFGISLLSCLIILEFGVSISQRLSVFVLVLAAYTLLVTTLNLAVAPVPLELLQRDLMMFVPLLMVLELIRYVDPQTLLKITARLVTVQFALALLIGNYFDYGTGPNYTVLSAAGYLFLPVLLLSSISRYEKLIYASFYVLLASNGLLFLGGKIYVILGLSVLYFCLVCAKGNWLLSTIVSVFLLLIASTATMNINIFDFSIDAAEKIDDIAAYKLKQVFMIFDSTDLMNSHTSVGSIFAEIFTLLHGNESSLSKLVVGRGLGGGVKDSFQALAPWVDAGGYDKVQFDHDHYSRLHLTALNLLLKFGLIFFVTVAAFWLRRRRQIDALKLFCIGLPVFLLLADANIQSFVICSLLVMVCFRQTLLVNPPPPKRHKSEEWHRGART